AGAPSLEPLPLDVLHGVGMDGLLALPGLARADAEAGVAARVGGAAEADLVPRPGVRIEHGQGIAGDDAPGAGDVELVPDAALELGRRERVDDPPAGVGVDLGEHPGAAAGGLVQAARDELPGLAVR